MPRGARDAVSLAALPVDEATNGASREKFAASFAADVPARDAAFMADSQVPWGVEALNGEVSEAAGRSKPRWYLVSTDDRMIPPPLQRTMSERAGATVAGEAGSHSIFISEPQAVVAVIEQAAQSGPSGRRDPAGHAPGREGRCPISTPLAGRTSNVLPATSAGPSAQTLAPLGMSGVTLIEYEFTRLLRRKCLRQARRLPRGLLRGVRARSGRPQRRARQPQPLSHSRRALGIRSGRSRSNLAVQVRLGVA